MVRKGETISDAAQRILKAELGLGAERMEMMGYIEYPSEKVDEGGISTHSVSLIFKTKLQKGEIRGSSQAKEIELFGEIPEHTIQEVIVFLKENWDKLS